MTATIHKSQKYAKKPWAVQYRAHFWYFATYAQAAVFAAKFTRS